MSLIFILFMACSQDNAVESIENELYDYMPLEIGNTWEYEYSESGGGEYHRHWTNGTCIWRVTSVVYKENEVYYMIEEQRIATWTKRTQTDTLIIETRDINEFTTMQIVQDENNKIRILTDRLSILRDMPAFERYQAILEPLIRFRPEEGPYIERWTNVDITLGTGIVRINWFVGAINWSEGHYILKNSSFN